MSHVATGLSVLLLFIAMFGTQSKQALADSIGPAVQAVKDAGRAMIAVAVVAITALVVSIIALVQATRTVTESS